MSKLRVIESGKTIGDLFTNLARQEEIPVSVHNEEEKMYAMLKFLDDEKSPYIVSRDQSISLESGQKTELTFFYKETFINFFTSVEDIADEKYFIKKPSSIRTSYNRTKTRYNVKKKDNVFVVIYGVSDRYPAIDISTSGISFEADRELFGEGQAIRNIMITLGNDLPVYVDGIVKYVKSIGDGCFRFGIEFLSIEWMFYQKIFSFVFEKGYPDIKQMRDYSIEDISNLYNESKYIAPKNSTYNKGMMTEILKVERLKDKPMIAMNLVQQKNENIVAVASAVRNFNKGFYVQKILTVPDEEVENVQRTDMYAGIADGLLGHPYFETLIMYVNDDVEWDMEMFRIMQEIIDDETKVSFKGFNIYACSVEQCLNEVNLVTNKTDDFSNFLKWVNTSSNSLEMSAYSYNKGQFWLGKLKENYRISNFEINRDLFEVKNGEDIIAYAVSETVSKDIDIDGFMNGFRLYLVDENVEVDDVIASLVEVVKPIFTQKGIESFKIIVDHDVSISSLCEVESTHRLLMSREGVVEFLYFLKANIV